MKAGSIWESWRESHTYGKTSRMDYIIDLITNYCPTLDDLCQDCQEMIIVAYTDKNEPMTESESNQFYKAIFSILEEKGIKPNLIYGNADDVRGEIALRIIGISNLQQNDKDDE